MTNLTYKIASNTFYQLLGKVVTVFITITVTMLITRFYGRSAYGEFSLMQNWPAFFFIIVDFGINAVATREISKNENLASKYISNIIFIRLFLSFIFIIFSIFLVQFFPYESSLKHAISLSLFLIATQAVNTSLNIIFQSKLRYDYATFCLILGYLIILIFNVFFAINRYPVLFMSLSYILGGMVSFSFSMYFVKKLGTEINFSLDFAIWRYLFYQTLPLGIMFIFSQINFKIDEILLSVLKLPDKFGLSNTETVGIYSLAYKIFEVSLVIPTFIMNAVYPVLIRKLQESPHALKSVFLRTIRTLFGLGLLSGILGYVFAPLAIKILGGPDFSSSVPLLRILLGGGAVFYLSQPFSWFIVTLEKQIYLPFVYALGALLNFALNICFIPRYSFYAASVITHISELFILTCLIFISVRIWKEKYVTTTP